MTTHRDAEKVETDAKSVLGPEYIADRERRLRRPNIVSRFVDYVIEEHTILVFIVGGLVFWTLLNLVAAPLLRLLGLA